MMWMLVIQKAAVDHASALSAVAVPAQLSAIDANCMLTMMHNSATNVLTTAAAAFVNRTPCLSCIEYTIKC